MLEINLKPDIILYNFLLLLSSLAGLFDDSNCQISSTMLHLTPEYAEVKLVSGYQAMYSLWLRPVLNTGWYQCISNNGYINEKSYLTIHCLKNSRYKTGLSPLHAYPILPLKTITLAQVVQFVYASNGLKLINFCFGKNVRERPLLTNEIWCLQWFHINNQKPT